MTSGKDFKMRNNPRSALWVGVLILDLFAVGSSFAQNGKAIGRRDVAKAHLLGATNFMRVASLTTADATDSLAFPSDAAGEARRRQMLESFAAERANRSRAAAVLAAPVQIPNNVPGLAIAEEAHGTQGFAGISNFTQAGANFGFSVEPPDQGLAVGNGYVLEAVNSALAVYSDKGLPLVGPVSLNQFFGQLPVNDPAALNVSDPRCLYDPATNRWFVSAVGYGIDLTGNVSSSALLIAVSDSGSPTGNFALYALDTTSDGSDFYPGDCPCLGDQPLLGADANGIYLSTNAFGQTSFQGAQLYMVSKSALVTFSAFPSAAHFDQLSAVLPDVEFSFSVQPSFSPPTDPGEAGTEYFVQAMRALQLEQRIAVWALSNTAAINTDPTKLTLNFAVLPSQVYAGPVSASQKAGSTPLAERAARGGAPGPANEQNLDGNDHRMQQVMFARGKLWTSVGTALTGPGSPVRDGAAWFVIDVKNPPAGLQATISSQGYVAGPENSHLIYPSVGVTASGRAVMAFTLTGEDFFPSAAYWSFGGESIHVLSKGVLPQDGFSAYFFNRPRWGDYSAAAVSSDGTIWVATEMIPGGPRKTFANWGTFIAGIHPIEDSSANRHPK
jgi:hypothetical protein